MKKKRIIPNVPQIDREELQEGKPRKKRNFFKKGEYVEQTHLMIAQLS